MEDHTVYSAMQTGEPLARFKKTIIGKVHVTILDPFSDKPKDILLSGNQDANEPTAYTEIWTEKALVFFRRINRKHFEAGRLTEMVKPVTQSKSSNEISDTEIDELLASPFLKLKNRVDKFTDTAPLFRLVNAARAADKSEKIVKFLEGRMSELEMNK